MTALDTVGKSERDEPENDNGEDRAVCEFCHRPIFGRIVMDENYTPSCQECASPRTSGGGDG